MHRVLFALAIFAVAPLSAAHAAGIPAHFGSALSRQISSDGPRAAAWSLTLNHNWTSVERDVAANDPALSAGTLRALLDYTPRSEKAAMQRALRTRLQVDALSGLAVLSPISHSPYSGLAVCGGGEARWKHQIHSAVTATHDVMYALQRESCVNALRLHSAR